MKSEFYVSESGEELLDFELNKVIYIYKLLMAVYENNYDPVHA